MQRSLQQQYGVQKNAKVLGDQLKEDYKSNMKLNVWALRDEMSAVRLSVGTRFCPVAFVVFGVRLRA